MSETTGIMGWRASALRWCVVLIFAIAVVAPASSFLMTFLGWVVGFNSDVGFTSGWFQTYLVGTVILGPLLSLTYLIGHRWSRVTAGLSTVAYASLMLLVTIIGESQGNLWSHWQLNWKDLLMVAIFAAVGFGAGYCLEVAARQINRMVPLTV